MLSCILLLCTLSHTILGTPSPCAGNTFRNYDGTCNNLNNPTRGTRGSFYSRSFGMDCDSNVLHIPERNLTNTFLSEEGYKQSALYTIEERRFGLSPSPVGLNTIITGFHQFVEHDRGLARLQGCFSPSCFIPSPIPSDDFLYMTTDKYAVPVNRTQLFIPAMVLNTTFQAGVLNSWNDQTAYLDGSAIYGPTVTVTNGLRTFTNGQLRMRTDVGDRAEGELPNSTALTGVPNQCGTFGSSGMASGDPRTETNSVLAAIHTLFVREHNRLARNFKLLHPFWNDETIFQAARNYNIALLQHFAVDELVPAQFGQKFADENIGAYTGYDSTVDVTLPTPFGLAANRIVHDQVSLPMLVLNSSGAQLMLPGTEGFPNIERINCIADTFWSFGTDAILRGAAQQYAQKFDGKVVDDIRSFPAKISTALPYNFDVEGMTLSRSIEVKEISYYHLRKALGDDIYTKPGCTLNVTHTTTSISGVSCPKVVRSVTEDDPIACFQYITGNYTRAAQLKAFYGRVDRVHPHVGMIVETTRTETGFPLTAAKLFAREINAVRAGDRFWYENYQSHGLLTALQVLEIRRTSFYDFIRRNTSLKNSEINDAAFTVVNPNA